MRSLTVSEDSPVDVIRDRLAQRSQRIDARFPRALDLEAHVLASMYGHLHGSAALYSGTHCPEHWREMLRGQRSLHLADVCRLVSEPGAEGHAAARAPVTLLAGELGLAVSPADGRPVRGIGVEAAEVAQESAALAYEAAAAIEDDALDNSEVHILTERLGSVRKQVADVEALLQTAKAVQLRRAG